MIEHRGNGLAYYQFPNLLAFSEIQHGVFTRKGGCSPAPFSSLNVSLGVGDQERRVERNRQMLSGCFGEQNLVFLNQVHGSHVEVFSRDDDPIDSSTLPVGDAMVTDRKHAVLVIQVADCQAILLYDPVKHVIAAIHSGWRGSIGNIIGETIGVMTARFSCLAEDIVAGISPSLGPCCAEFVNYRDEIPSDLWGYRDESDHFDFWSISCHQLCDAGVDEDHIHISRICTRCDTNRFFSYRGEGITGRFAVLIGLA